MSYIHSVPPSLGQLRLDLSRRLTEATVLGTAVSFDGIDYYHYAPAEMLEVVNEFATYAHKITDIEWPRFMRLIHKDLYRRGYVYSKWDRHKTDILVKALSDYLKTLR